MPRNKFIDVLHLHGPSLVVVPKIEGAKITFDVFWMDCFDFFAPVGRVHYVDERHIIQSPTQPLEHTPDIDLVSFVFVFNTAISGGLFLHES